MSKKPKKKLITLEVPVELLALADKRLRNLGIKRTSYIINLMKNDVAAGGSFVIQADQESGADQNPSNPKTT